MKRDKKEDTPFYATKLLCFWCSSEQGHQFTLSLVEHGAKLCFGTTQVQSTVLIKARK
jgi:hypothetical protein